jgi:two-component sensor kinase, probably involved in phosphate sensing
MSIFSFAKKKEVRNPAEPSNGNTTELANLVLNSIEEGVIIVHPSGVVLLANPAAMRMLGVTDTSAILNVQISSLLRLENGEGMKLEDSVNPVLLAVNSGENYSTRDFVLVNLIEQRKPVAISVVSTNSGQNERIITLRDISRELEEEGEQTEFISTASHEMRTPVASIEGYLGLALNPKTATIDERARKYLEEAHTSSKHLGRLFKDLLDVTKLDDKKIRVQLSPVEMTSTVRSIANGQVPQMSDKGIHYTFGSNGTSTSGNGRFLNQEVYASVDIDFLREAVNNLVENAIKYTAEGGGIWVNVRGDDDRVLINVTDTGIGISPDDLKHVFQKFYRADNSQTRTVGGTGLGLYLVKQRVEAMGGKVWAESSFGEGSTFYLSFPRITAEEYQRRKQIASNIEAMSAQKQATPTVTQAETQESQNPIVASTADTPVAPTTTNVSETVNAPVNPVVPVTPNTFTATVAPAVSAAPVTTATPVVPAAPATSATPTTSTTTATPVVSVAPTVPANSRAESPAIEPAQQSVTTPTQQPVATSAQQPVTTQTQQPIAMPTVQPNVIAAQQPLTTTAQQPLTTTAQQPVTNSGQQFITTPAQQPANNTQRNINSQSMINSQPVAPQTPQNLSQTTPPSVNNFNQVPPLNN